MDASFSIGKSTFFLLKPYFDPGKIRLVRCCEEHLEDRKLERSRDIIYDIVIL
jgi:hypothetical protein